MAQVVFKGKYHETFQGVPITLEWELPDFPNQIDGLVKILDRTRKIAKCIEEIREKRRWRFRRQLSNQLAQARALESLRFLFERCEKGGEMMSGETCPHCGSSETWRTMSGKGWCQRCGKEFEVVEVEAKT